MILFAMSVYYKQKVNCSLRGCTYIIKLLYHHYNSHIKWSKKGYISYYRYSTQSTAKFISWHFQLGTGLDHTWLLDIQTPSISPYDHLRTVVRKNDLKKVPFNRQKPRSRFIVGGHLPLLIWSSIAITSGTTYHPTESSYRDRHSNINTIGLL